MTKNPSVFLGLGSNLGDRAQNLSRARDALRGRGVAPMLESALYLTEPVGGEEQPWYLNQVLAVETALDPLALLAAGLAVEGELRRVRAEKNGPRTLDVDVLLYGDVVMEGAGRAGLTVPHPRMAERRFVLVPLVEIAPEARHPVSGLSAAAMLARCPDRSRVTPYMAAAGERA